MGQSNLFDHYFQENEGALEDAQKDWEAGEHVMFVDAVRFVDNMDDGVLRIVFDLKGGEEHNKNLPPMANWFRYSEEKGGIRFLVDFLHAIGVTEKLSSANMEQVCRDQEGVYFVADVVDNPPYKNVYARRPYMGEKAGEASTDFPG